MKANKQKTGLDTTKDFTSIPIETMNKFSPSEYMILNYMLFRKNLSKWNFYISDLVKNTGLSKGSIFNVLKKFKVKNYVLQDHWKHYHLNYTTIHSDFLRMIEDTKNERQVQKMNDADTKNERQVQKMNDVGTKNEHTCSNTSSNLEVYKKSTKLEVIENFSNNPENKTLEEFDNLFGTTETVTNIKTQEEIEKELELEDLKKIELCNNLIENIKSTPVGISDKPYDIYLDKKFCGID